jgi:ABC-type glycerol-3-phosphate transport system substrate-binding protein
VTPPNDQSQPFRRILAAVLILIGFSSGSFVSVATAATVVHWLTLSDGAWPASVKKVIAAFEAENPDIKIQLDTYPFRQLFETIEVRMKSQDKDVDLMSVDVPLVASYSVRGFLAPLDEYFPQSEIEKTWVQASWRAGSHADHFMAARKIVRPSSCSSTASYSSRPVSSRQRR